MTRWSALRSLCRTRPHHSALAYGSRSAVRATVKPKERLVHHDRGRYSGRWGVKFYELRDMLGARLDVCYFKTISSGSGSPTAELRAMRLQRCWEVVRDLVEV